MPQISSSFILRSKLSNFQRDSFDSKDAMNSVLSEWMDEGHISYCKEDGKHYIFKSVDDNNQKLFGADRWRELLMNDLEELSYNVPVYDTIDEIKNICPDFLGEDNGIPSGTIIYCREDHNLYYNIADDSKGQGNQDVIHHEYGFGWFRPLTLQDTYSKSEIDNIISGVNEEKPDGDPFIRVSELDERLENLEGGSVDLSGYATKTELGEVKSELGEVKDDVSLNTNAIKGIDNRVDALESSTVSKEELADKGYATTGFVAESCAAVQSNVKTLNDKIDSVSNRVSQVENDINGYEDESGEYQSGIKDIIEKHNLDLYGDGEDAKGIIQDLEDYKTHVADTYETQTGVDAKIDAKIDKVVDVKLTNYYPLIETEGDRDVWVGSDEYGELSGKTKSEINGKYTYSGVFDEILFNRINPDFSQPSLRVDLDTSYTDDNNPWFVANNISWLDESKRTILVPAYSVTPNSEDFIATDIKDSYISYPESYVKNANNETINKYTNGLRDGSDGYPRTIGNCKVLKDNQWVDYSENYGLPTTETLVPGEYHYHIIGYFAGINPIINNFNEKIKEPWDSNIPIESENFITLYASKPMYYNTAEGMKETELKIWNDDLMYYEASLLPTCQLEQSFSIPRKIKALYIWNDFIGGYGQIPMVDGVPAYFVEEIEGDYYTYRYDSNSHGHRGAIKIKVEF